MILLILQVLTIALLVEIILYLIVSSQKEIIMGGLPNSREPVLAQIQRGQHKWYEVVYYDSNLQSWCGQHGSDTFHTGEDMVLNWQYCKEVLDD